MLSDEIPVVQALEIALASIRDSIRTHDLFQSRLKNRILKYQYEALLDDLRQQERSVLHAVKDREPETQPSTRRRYGKRTPDDAALSSMAISELLNVIAKKHDERMATFADMAARVSDGPVKTLLHEMSETAFAHKSKALTDLQLMRQHRDYQ